ncbi:hypothetical protein J6590_060620 [Homalodisca vitripennis]|nr:hypothetical protein J6590_060620 [Homalodisca vitripennis]
MSANFHWSRLFSNSRPDSHAESTSGPLPLPGLPGRGCESSVWTGPADSMAPLGPPGSSLNEMLIGIEKPFVYCGHRRGWQGFLFGGRGSPRFGQRQHSKFP